MKGPSVIIPARDAEQTLPRTLSALADQDLGGPYEVIVVDDGSSDRTAALARQASAVVVQQPPLGPAAARNRGAEAASGAQLAFCDADVFPSTGWLRAGVEALGRADLVQGKVEPDPGAPLGPFDRSLWITGQVGLWETANLFVTRDVFDRVGGFQEPFRPRLGKAMGEDVMFGYRAIRAGARASYCEAALAHHAVLPRRWTGFVAERARLWYFPALVRRVPELRRTFLYRRAFLNRRSASFDLTAAAFGWALRRRSPAPLVLATPYLVELNRHSRRCWPAGPLASQVVAADLLADVVGCAALLGGSVRYLTAVL